MSTTANTSRAGIALLALAISIGLSLGVATPANADPKSGVVPLECDELGTLEIVVAGTTAPATTR